MCRDTQSIADEEKADRMDGANGANGVSEADGGGVDAEESDGADRVDKTGGGKADAKEPDGTNRADGADGADRTDRADGTNGADRADKADKVDRVNGTNKSGVDAKELGDPRDLGLRNPRAEVQKVARQVAIRLSFFSFRILLCLFFSFFKSETYDSA